MAETVRLDTTLVMPTMTGDDRCLDMLGEWITPRKGIEKAHIVREAQDVRLCVHYDPNLITIPQIERIAKEAGATLSDRYRHEQIAFTGMDVADAASQLDQLLAQLPGMLHASVNYAAGLIFVAYDSTVLNRTQIDAEIRRFGARPLGTTPAKPVADDHDHGNAKTDPHGDEKGNSGGEHDGHDHGSAPAFLPHWMQERWTLLLVAAAGVFFLIGWVGETYLNLSPTIALVLYILAYVAGGYDVATHAIPGLLRGKFNTDILMLAAAAGAAFLGEWAEGSFLLFLFALGHAGEHYALDRARSAVNALGELMPRRAQVKRGDAWVDTDVDELVVGDVVLSRPGDRVAVDGEIVSGTSDLDQAAITGESAPVNKTVGDTVFAGTINHTAALDLKVTRLARDNTLSRVMKLVAEAQSQQSPTQQFTDRFTAWFVPAVLLVVLGVIVVPPLAGWMPWQDSFYRAMLLLVASSPCALALGTPAAVLAGIAQAARQGVLIKGGVHLENLGSLRVMAFDKTGTLTTGKFAVTEAVPVSGVTEQELVQMAAAMEQASNHPLAAAVVTAARERKVSLAVVQGVTNVPGKGLRGTLDGKTVEIGSMDLFDTPPDATLTAKVKELQGQGRSTMVVRRDGQFLGVLGLADTLRPNVASTMKRLRDLGIQHLVLLTGDNQAVAERISKEANVTDVRAELMPEDKLTAISALQQTYGAVAMTGDGVNDAPALATSTVGIAMGGAGTAVALETADVALMGDDIGKLPFAVGLSRASRAVIQQNLAVSLGIIAFLIVSSVIGWVQLSGAVILHEGSTLVVVINALRLLGYRDSSS